MLLTVLWSPGFPVGPRSPNVIQFGLYLGDAGELQLQIPAAVLNNAHERDELAARNRIVRRPLFNSQDSLPTKIG
jgi:hypothetical protein